MSGLIPIYSFPKGNPVDINSLPPDTIFRWIEPYGGGVLDGPIPWGTDLPNGKGKAHGAIAGLDEGNMVVEYHLHVHNN